ncbi:MAG: glyoxalase superfamily protein [Sneathiella sp.]
MSNPNSIPEISVLKQQAADLRAEKKQSEQPISHSRALELLAHKYGFKDWNCLRAAAEAPGKKCPVSIGQRVTGLYLGQPFEALTKSIAETGAPGRFRVSFHFDEPMDVVTFDSFSNFRQRISCTMNHKGITDEETSDGTPHLQLNL